MRCQITFGGVSTACCSIILSVSLRHTGFSVHSRVRAKTKPEAERVGKYMIRPVLALERLMFLEPEGKIGYRYGQDARD